MDASLDIELEADDLVRVRDAAFDVVKTRMQGLQASQYKSTLDCVRQMIRKEGPLVFYSGVVPRLGRVIPGQGVIFMTYDGVTRLVSRYLEQPSRQALY